MHAYDWTMGCAGLRARYSSEHTALFMSAKFVWVLSSLYARGALVRVLDQGRSEIEESTSISDIAHLLFIMNLSSITC